MTQAGVVVPACGQCWVGRVEADRAGPTVTFPAAVPLAYWLPVVATSWCGTHDYLPNRSTVGTLASCGRYVLVWDPRLPSQPQYRWRTGFWWSLLRGFGPTVTFPATVPFACATGWHGNVTSVGWQVTPCGPIWHVSSRSYVAGYTANCYLYPYTSLYFAVNVRPTVTFPAVVALSWGWSAEVGPPRRWWGDDGLCRRRRRSENRNPTTG